MQNRKEYHKKYYQKHKKKILIQMKNYRQINKEYKIKNKKWCKEHYLKNRDYYRKKQVEYSKTLKGKASRKKADKKHLQTEKGKITNRKIQSKRRRNLGFTILLENKFNCAVDYHHINNEYVIAVPRYMHQGTLGKNHRVECNSLVEKLYNIDIENEVEKYERDKI